MELLLEELHEGNGVVGVEVDFKNRLVLGTRETASLLQLDVVHRLGVLLRGSHAVADELDEFGQQTLVLQRDRLTHEDLLSTAGKLHEGGSRLVHQEGGNAVLWVRRDPQENHGVELGVLAQTRFSEDRDDFSLREKHSAVQVEVVSSILLLKETLCRHATWKNE